MKKIIYTSIVLITLVLLGTSCNDEWKDEQFTQYIGLGSTIDSGTGVTAIYVPYSRKDTTGKYIYGDGRSNYELPVIVSGSKTNERNILVHVALDPDTLSILNIARFQNRTDLYYTNMKNYASFSDTIGIKKGEDLGLLDIGFDFRSIDMSEKWVLPITVADSSSYDYKSNPRKNYKKALLRIYPFNSYSGVYSGTNLLNYIKGDEGNGSIVESEVTGYVVNDSTIFFYAGTVDENREDRASYKIYAIFSGTDQGIVTFRCDNPNVNFTNNKEASFHIEEEMDAVQPYLKHRYVVINNIDYEYTDYTAVPGSDVTYEVKGSLTLERKINTEIPDEDQAIEW
jgi:hypothetical protein